MKTTIFHKNHKELGAKMVQFAGFEMPIQYPKGILAEHNAVRKAVGVFDVSHMGEFEVRGADALNFLQKITINDVSKLAEGKAQYSAMCRPDGGIVDDLLVYHMGDYYMMVVNGANIDKDFAWAKENTAGFDVDLQDKSDEFHLLAIQGPKAPETLAKLTDAPLNDIPYYNYIKGKLAGIDMIISRTGYTGEVGFELYFKAEEGTACRVWTEIFKAGEEFGIEAIGLGARDTLRLEKGYCLYGNDIDDKSNPLEAGLGWITKLNKGEFNGSEAIAKVKADGIERKLVGFKVTGEKFIARPHYPIMANGEQIGEVTSGNVSPALNVGIGLGYVKKEFSEPGTQIEISARGKTFPAEVVKFPFV